MSKTGLLRILLTDIIIGKTNPRAPEDLTEVALKDLTESIREKEVIQPILVRPVKGNKYELVCGERRFRASGFAGKTDIPCNVRDLTDDEALELQIIENLERKDVHPLHEAIAFKDLMEKRSYSLADLAAKFTKPEAFITARLKLNDIIPEFQKDFMANKMLIGHAVLIARMTPADQKEIYKNRLDWEKGYRSVESFKKMLQDNFICNLNASSFKKDDTDLYPAAGPCTVCPKRSGANSQLFPDIKEKDRCFDRACFQMKTNLFASQAVQKIIEENSDVVLLKNHHEPPKEIAELCKQHQVRILKEYDDFDTYSSGKKAKGFWVSGSDFGTYEQVTIRQKSSGSKSTSGGSSSPGSLLQSQIDGIKQREVRAKELDAEKVHAKVKEALKDCTAFQEQPLQLSKTEFIAGCICLSESSYKSRDLINKKLKIASSDYRQLKPFHELSKLSLGDLQLLFNQAMRAAIFDKLCGNADEPGKSGCAAAIRNIAIDYMPEQVKLIDDEQAAAAEKRAGRVQKRLEDLQKEKKAAAAAVKKPAAKKAESKPSAKKSAVKKKPAPKKVKSVANLIEE